MSSLPPENGPDHDPRHGIAWGPSIPRGGLPPTEEDEDAPSIRLRGAVRKLSWLAVGIIVVVLLLLGAGLFLYQQARLTAMRAQAEAQARAQLQQANAQLQVEAAEKDRALREAEQIDHFGNNNRWRADHHLTVKKGLFSGKKGLVLRLAISSVVISEKV
jgi:hypothetical protein